MGFLPMYPVPVLQKRARTSKPYHPVDWFGGRMHVYWTTGGGWTGAIAAARAHRTTGKWTGVKSAVRAWAAAE